MRDEIPFGLDEDDSNTLEALRIALSSLEAEAVAFVMADDLKDSSIISTPAYRDLGEAMERTVGDLYTAPPAPVSAPDFDALRLLFEASERKSDHGFNLHKYGIGYADKATQARWEVWVACRAAMLQGADGNSPVIPDGWVACSERMPEDEQEVLTRNKMGHCFVSFFDEHSGLFFDRIDVAAACCIEHILVTHWMPLPAAPQQEVR
ncbi:TPA: DUF551 domain-containing protein [Enterobacter asburiae]|nr:DUF551 domain-containing protein [Enterobacter cloacae complex sp. S3]HBL7126834.1 DUF551 domain-containing protein [Enterobacter asburiae]HCW3081862.1 DUF551 domain-containing protein [Enterobacter asburiae]HCW3091417.1 DUF551 domain-containing protein [Enterobacter asburiae]HCW3147008.1 DUF551 domain-containing protein [Enterobacter asburiae]